jgi:dolichol-phosphate mannosyltransferase
VHFKVEVPVSVIIPAFNEEESVGKTLGELYEYLRQTFAEFEILIIDDGSTDNTGKELARLKTEYEKMSYVCLGENMGQSMALISGIKASKHNLIIMMDGDGQYFPGDIKKLYDKLSDPVRLVSGKRDNRKDSFLYRTASLVGNRFIAWMFGVKRFDLGCGLKIGYRNDLLLLPYFNNIHRYLQIIYIHSGLSVDDVEISHRKREMGKSKYSILKIFNIIPRLLWLKTVGLKLKKTGEA